MEGKTHTKGSKITLCEQDQFKFYALNKSIKTLKLILVLTSVIMVVISVN